MIDVGVEQTNKEKKQFTQEMKKIFIHPHNTHRERIYNTIREAQQLKQ